MRIRFGYVAIALAVPEGSPNKTVTVKTIEKIKNPKDQVNRLRRIGLENLETTLRILRHNTAHQIHVYRFTSKLIPLATHPIAENWDYITDFEPKLKEIGDYIRLHNIRTSAHPDHYTLLNSPRKDVLTASLLDLDYHVRLFEAMGFACSPSLVMHVGGLYKDKPSSLARFKECFRLLPERLRSRIMLENDDKTYTAADVLALCQELSCPMVLDLHHFHCNNSGEKLEELWPNIIATWSGKLPKIHISSPKTKKDIRSHADYVNPADILPFLAIAKKFGHDFDVMVEAKQKDNAMFRLVETLASQPGVKPVNLAMIEL